MQKFAQVNLSDKYLVSMGTQLGKGSTGCVYEGKDLKNNQKVAVKIIELLNIDNQVTQYLLQMEKKALMAIKNPYVLRGLKIWQDNKYCFMVTEYCNGGTLKSYIHKKGKLSEDKSIDLVHKILDGYQHLVQKGIVHRDLKPANIMMHEESPKIIDFGYCEISGYKKPSLEYNVGSPSYMAPESFDLNIYNEKTQIWAIGVILFECVTGRTIDQGRKMTEAYRQIEETGVPYPSHVSRKVRKIVDWCLSLSPRKRPSCEQLLKQFNQMKKNQQKSLFEDLTNESVMTGRRSNGHRYTVNLNENKNEYDLVKSTRVPEKKMSKVEQYAQNLKYKYLPKKSNENKAENRIENRIKSSYSNYVKPHSLNTSSQQPETFNYKNDNTDRNNGHGWDYGLSKKIGNVNPTKYNNYVAPVKANRDHHRGITLHQLSNNTPSLLEGRKKKVETSYMRTYRN